MKGSAQQGYWDVSIRKAQASGSGKILWYWAGWLKSVHRSPRWARPEILGVSPKRISVAFNHKEKTVKSRMSWGHWDWPIQNSFWVAEFLSTCGRLMCMPEFQERQCPQCFLSVLNKYIASPSPPTLFSTEHLMGLVLGGTHLKNPSDDVRGRRQSLTERVRTEGRTEFFSSYHLMCDNISLQGRPKAESIRRQAERDSREARHRVGSSKNISSLDLLLLCAAFCGGTIGHSQSETHSLLSQEALCLRTGTTPRSTPGPAL